MCRLMSGHLKTLEQIPHNELLAIFLELEKLQGGAGNGIAGTFEDGTVRRLRGVSFTCENAVIALYKWKNEGLKLWQFHSRLVSSGSKADDQCHPHFCFDSSKLMRGFLMQNGTMSGSSFDMMKRLFGGKMDTEVVANALYKIDKTPKEILMALDTAIWVLTTKDSTLAVNANQWNGDLLMYQKCHAIISSPLLNKYGDSVKIESKGWVNIDREGKMTHYKGVEKSYSFTPNSYVGTLYGSADDWRRYYELEDAEECDDGPIIASAQASPDKKRITALVNDLNAKVGTVKSPRFNKNMGYDVFKIVGSGDNGKTELIAHTISRSVAIKSMRSKKEFCCAIADDRSDVLVDNFSTLYWVFDPTWNFLGYTKNYNDIEKLMKGNSFVNVRGKLNMELRPANNFAIIKKNKEEK